MVIVSHRLRAGMAAITDKQMAQAEAQFKKFESMINSMTPVRTPLPQSPSSTLSACSHSHRGVTKDILQSP